MIFMFVPFGVIVTIAIILVILFAMYSDPYYVMGIFWFITFAIWFIKTLIKEASTSDDEEGLDDGFKILVGIMAVVSSMVTMICMQFT